MSSKLIFIIGIASLQILITSCSSSSAINDFFGIEMPPSEVDYFRIVGYTESSGISYQSTKNMNPNLFAWAGIEIKSIRVIISNSTNEPIELKFNDDQFLLIEKEGNEYVLDKGSMLDYDNKSPIAPNSSVELVFELPKDYVNSLYINRNDDFLNDMTREQNTAFYDKERISKLQIKLGYTKTIILKPVNKYTK